MLNEFGAITPTALIVLGVFLTIAEMFIVGTFASMFIAIACLLVGLYGYINPELAWEQQVIIIAVSSLIVTALFGRKLFNRNAEGDVVDKHKIEGSRGIGTFSRSLDGAPSMVSYRGTFFSIHPDSLERSQTLQSGDSVDIIIESQKAKILS